MKLSLLIGGQGTCAESIVKAIRCGELPAQCVGAICHNPQAKGIERLEQLGIEVTVINRKSFDDKASFEQELIQVLEQQQPDVIALAGFMCILSPHFVNFYPNQIVNIHPSLLPKYPGLNTHQRVIDQGDALHGSTIHIVTAQCDAGPILNQATIPVLDCQQPERLEERLKPLEHQLYIDTLAVIAEHNDFTERREIYYPEQLKPKPNCQETLC